MPSSKLLHAISPEREAQLNTAVSRVFKRCKVQMRARAFATLKRLAHTCCSASTDANLVNRCLLEKVKLVQYKPGQPIVRRGEASDAFFVVARGTPVIFT